MDGATLNGYFENSLLSKAKTKVLVGKWSDLEVPSDLGATNGVADSVTEQAHRVDATWSDANKTLTIAKNANGHGYWIPYLGNGIPNVGTDKRGLGTYTPAIGTGSAISWVATGPFSGCYAVKFSSGAGAVFAHVITPAAGYTTEDPSQQAADISRAVGANNPGLGDKITCKKGLGFLLWTNIKGVWWQRVINTMPGAGTMSWVGKKGRA